jgi:hypothetical protein
MMFYPSGIKLPKDREFEVENLGDGLYAVKNAYEGSYEYFEGRPIEVSNEKTSGPGRD